MQLSKLSALVLLALAPVVALAQPDSTRTSITRASDPALTQKWVSEFGYSFMFPATVKYNTIGSAVSRAGQTERQNFMIPGGNGRIQLQYFTEQRMVPKNYQLLDSVHVADFDSAGTNGRIYRRFYIMRDYWVQIDILLTPKGEETFKPMIRPIFDSFLPPPTAIFALEAWRYGRNPKEFESGRYPANGGGAK
jgi:hypothetical protein